MGESLPKTDRLLEVEDLGIEFPNGSQTVRAVDGVNFTIAPGQILALVGESGSGKSVTALALTRLLASPPANYTSGKVLFEGRDLLKCPPTELRMIRGRKVAYVFQEPSTSLNPVLTVARQLAEVVELHRPEVRHVAEEIQKALTAVGIRDPQRVAKSYSHELSGGMQQRVMIAMALLGQPKLLIADEPTTALDVTIQSQILELICDVRKQYGMAVLLITHNFGVVANVADAVAVMYRGKIVENGPVNDVLTSPQHPYTKALIDCIPRLGDQRRRLTTIDYEMLK